MTAKQMPTDLATDSRMATRTPTDSGFQMAIHWVTRILTGYKMMTGLKMDFGMLTGFGMPTGYVMD